MEIFLVTILGLVVGSFLNAVIYRLHAGERFWRGRSHCTDCKHELAWYDLIPLVSFLILRAKCRYCHKPISWQYPLVEAGMALALVFLFLKFGLTITFSVYGVYAIFLLLIFVYDLRYYLILDVVSLPAIIVAFLLSVFVLGFVWWQVLLAAGIGGGFFLLQFLISRGKWIGGGDIRLGVLMGCMLGWPEVLVALGLAYILGSLIGVGLIIGGKKQWGSQVPFGTFLTFATYLAFFWGEAIVNYYRDALWL